MQWEAWIFVAVRCWAMLCCAANAHRAKKHLKQTAWINVNDNWPETGNVYYIRLAWLFWQILWSGYLLFVLVMDVSLNVLCVCLCVCVCWCPESQCVYLRVFELIFVCGKWNLICYFLSLGSIPYSSVWMCACMCLNQL